MDELAVLRHAVRVDAADAVGRVGVAVVCGVAESWAAAGGAARAAPAG